MMMMMRDPMMTRSRGGHGGDAEVLELARGSRRDEGKATAMIARTALSLTPFVKYFTMKETQNTLYRSNAQLEA